MKRINADMVRAIRDKRNWKSYGTQTIFDGTTVHVVVGTRRIARVTDDTIYLSWDGTHSSLVAEKMTAIVSTLLGRTHRVVSHNQPYFLSYYYGEDDWAHFRSLAVDRFTGVPKEKSYVI